MATIVSDHQTCAIKGRKIQTNIHVLRTILDFARIDSDQVVVLQVDLSKTFDRVSHTFLFSVLRAMGFGAAFIERLQLCYWSVTLKLIVNNQCTKPVLLGRSVRQGCPLSPLLFDIYLEPLCQSVIQNANISGYRFGNVETKVLAYADVFGHASW